MGPIGIGDRVTSRNARHPHSVIRESGDRVLVVLHSVVSDAGVISAAEHLVAGDAVVRYLRVVPRAKAFTQVLSPAPTLPGDPSSPHPLRIVTAGDNMASTI